MRLRVEFPLHATASCKGGPAMPAPDGQHWVGTWTTTPAPVEGVRLSNQTLRMIARVSIGGSSLRVRLSNAHGTRPLAVGAAHIGLRDQAAAIVPGTDRPLTFGGLCA